VDLPKAVTGQAQDATRLTVTLNAQGQISLNQQPVALRDLKPRIQALIGTNSALVIINADEQVSHGQVVAVMDQLRQISGVKLAIATQRP
jgi:biopolymer transport protein ExbD